MKYWGAWVFHAASDDSGMEPDGGNAVCSLGDETFFSWGGRGKDNGENSVASQLVMPLTGEDSLQGRGRPANRRKGRKLELGHNSKRLFCEFSGVFRPILFWNSLTKKELLEFPT